MTPEDAIYALISGVASVPVVFSGQNGPRPGKPYIALTVRYAHAFPAHIGSTDKQGWRSVGAHRDAQVELQCYGAGCLDVLDGLSDGLSTEAALSCAEELNLAVFEWGRLQYVPVLRDLSSYEPRAILDCGIRYTREVIEQVGLIEAVEVTGHTGGGAAPTPPMHEVIRST